MGDKAEVMGVLIYVIVASVIRLKNGCINICECCMGDKADIMGALIYESVACVIGLI